MSEREFADIKPFQARPAWLRAAVLSVLLGALAFGIGLWLDPRQAMFSYLAAFSTAVSIAVGGLIFMMIELSMQASWPVALRRLSEAIVSTLPVWAITFIPIVIFADQLYIWVDPESLPEGHLRHLIEHKRPYLNLPFFTLRTVFYFAVWIGCAFLLRRWSLLRDRKYESVLDQRLKILSSAGLPIVGLTMVFAAFDWLMSLVPAWYSTMFGVYYFAGGFVAALGLLTVIAAQSTQAQRVLESRLRPDHFYALGRLLLAFTVFWAYTAFFQFFIIFTANKPEEVSWYVVRLYTSWGAVAAVLGFGRFVIPFFILLSYAIKRQPSRLAIVAGGLIVLHYVDMYWVAMPVLHQEAVAPHWLDAATLLLFGGLGVGCGLRSLTGKYPLPIGDPGLAKSLRYESL